MSFVLAITGPTGAGKSAVAEKLAKQTDQCVNIDADIIKHMIVGGFYKDESNAGGWSFNQWGLVGDSIGLLAKNFVSAGYNVIINGYIDELGWTNIQNHVPPTHKILLLPSIDTVTQRDSMRKEDARMGGEAVKEHHLYFSNHEFFRDFTKIDTTNHTEEETISEVLKVLQSHNARN